MLIAILIALHVLSIVFWVGGMSFMLAVLGRATGEMSPEQRFPLWKRTLAAFLPRIGGSAATVLVTGIWLIFAMFGGFSQAPLHVNVMMGLGILMMLLYLHLIFAPWKQFRAAVDGGDDTKAGRNLDMIRTTLGISAGLGVLTIISAVTGPYW